MSDTLTRLAEVLEARKGAAPDSSYVASLYHKGLNKILEKVGEESVETILAAKDAAINGDCSDLIYETADLWFHSLVMLAALDTQDAFDQAVGYYSCPCGSDFELTADMGVDDYADLNVWLGRHVGACEATA